MRVLVFGAGGQLGRDLLRVFQADHTVMGLTHSQLNIVEGEAVRIAVRDARPDVVLNAAAYTDVEKAEGDERTAFHVNANGAQRIAEACAALEVPVVYFSTDFVFDGTKRAPYEPTDKTSPQSVYAKSKARGEESTLWNNPQSFIIRTAWLYGPGGNNFVEKIISAAKNRPLLRVVNDEIGSPTYTRDLAEAARALVKTKAYGIYHAVNAGFCSRFEFAQAIVAAAGLDTPIEPCSASEYPMKAARPAYSVLSNEKLESACGMIMPDWRDALARYMKQRENAA
ncbi:MAG TPA: dTDP-4-dehydrorhamnose reductase [Candidatus Hydrogenedentes bacterium]|nr:dTDP-4-dehydrorhamnose reductase [Candidatus Hydrogenedentota bacterium]HRK33640.1 dTDP-4-dehydrorhamnose reductase [Candidatus Hydrogenedentota bacterium]